MCIYNKMLEITQILSESSAFPPDWHMKTQLGNSTTNESISSLWRDST